MGQSSESKTKRGHLQTSTSSVTVYYPGFTGYNAGGTTKAPNQQGRSFKSCSDVHIALAAWRVYDPLRDMQLQRDENEFIFMPTFQCIHLFALQLYVNMQFFLISWLSPLFSFIRALSRSLARSLSSEETSW